MPSSKSIIPADYAHWLTILKSRISSAQQRADDLIAEAAICARDACTNWLVCERGRRAK